MPKIVDIKIIIGIPEDYLEKGDMRGRYGSDSVISIEKRIITMLNEGWVTKGDVVSVEGDYKRFAQTMVKYEELPNEEPTPELKLEVRRKPVNN